MRSDLESSFMACYYLKDYRLRVSRRVTQVLLIAGRIDPSQILLHPTRKWITMCDNRVHIPFHGIVKHTHKGIVSLISDTIEGGKQAALCQDWTTAARHVLHGLGTGLGKGIGHLGIGCLSLYGEMTDVLNLLPSIYDPYT